MPATPITRHAIERAIERIPGCASEDDALRILTTAMIDKARAFAGNNSCIVRMSTGNRIVISAGVVKTVLPIKSTSKPKATGGK